MGPGPLGRGYLASAVRAESLVGVKAWPYHLEPMTSLALPLPVLSIGGHRVRRVHDLLLVSGLIPINGLGGLLILHTAVPWGNRYMREMWI